MDPGKLALASLATIGSGIILGLVVNPQLRTFPEQDWRARYRTAAVVPDPPPQPGVSYFGDGSTAWVFGRAAERQPAPSEALPLPHYREMGEPGARYGAPGDGDASLDVDSRAELAAAQAIVTRALDRSAPPQPERGASAGDGQVGQGLPDREDAAPSQADESAGDGVS